MDFCTFSQKTGDARAPLAPPVPTALYVAPTCRQLSQEKKRIPFFSLSLFVLCILLIAQVQTHTQQQSAELEGGHGGRGEHCAGWLV